MKKLLSKSYGIIVLICVVEFFLLCVCAIFIAVDTPEYQIIRWGRKQYFVFKDQSYPPPRIDEVRSSIPFDSLGELYNDFRTGNFTEYEYRELQKLDADTDGRFEMFDMNNLMIPSHLTSYFQLGWVGFHVGRLIFCFAVDDIFGSAYEITEQEYVDAQNEISNLPSEYDAEYDEERDVTVYHMNYGKSIVYSIVNKSKQMLVLEKYSDSALPWTINCYFKQDGKFYKLSLSDCKELPTKEWLSQFTMIKARS